jgi:tRNA pseudouridine-54 N-methylase
MPLALHLILIPRRKEIKYLNVIKRVIMYALYMKVKITQNIAVHTTLMSASKTL